jgi:hypothetical protein
VAIQVGGGASARRLSFKYDTALAEADEPDDFRGDLAPSVAIAGELYPMAFSSSSRGIVRNIGIGFAYERSFGVSGEFVDDAGMATTLSAEQQRLAVNLRYRHNFGDRPTHPSVTLSVGYSRSEVTIDDADGMSNLPDVAYQYVDPGIGVRFGLTPQFAIAAEGKGFLFFDAGEIQDPDQYGAAKLTGFDSELAAEYWITPNLLVRLGARLMLIGYDFKTDTATLIDPDGDGDPDVGGARDTWIGGQLAVGYAY